jgi:hypothetical protein
MQELFSLLIGGRRKSGLVAPLTGGRMEIQVLKTEAEFRGKLAQVHRLA